MNIYLHIGSHKTGTSAIQDFCRVNSEWLLQQGFIYPNLELIGQRPRRSHLDIVAAFANRAMKNLPLTQVQARDFFAAAFDLGRRENKHIFMSAENIFRFPEPRQVEFCTQLKSLAQENTIIPVLSLRRQDSFAESLYRNIYRLRAYKKRRPPFEKWLKRRMHLLDYRSVIERFENALSAAPIVVPYPGPKGDFLEFFFSKIGVDIRPAPVAPRRKNRSLDPVDCIAKNILADLGVTADVMERFTQFAIKSDYKSGYTFLTRGIRDLIERTVSEGNAEIIRRYPDLKTNLEMNEGSDLLRSIDKTCRNLAKQRIALFAETCSCGPGLIAEAGRDLLPLDRE